VRLTGSCARNRSGVSPDAGQRADQIGVVEAPNSDAAIKVAIKQFEITDKHEQSRNSAMPDG
jgi:hypothetical protein